MSLEACSKDRSVPQYMCKVVTPLKLQAWQDTLSTYILRGIESGFKIGFDSRSQNQNMCPALEQPEVAVHDQGWWNRSGCSGKNRTMIFGTK